MFESMTFDNIMEEMLGEISGEFDKREGSIIYDALAPAALELAQLYADLEAVLNQVFADTADREYLIRRAAERGVIPYEASCSRVKAGFDVDVGLGARFNLGDVNFAAVEYEGTDDEGHYIYILECETAGISGNITGTLIPIDNISGLTYAVASEITVYGDDEEETEDFRERYFDSINNIAFGGNIADYKEKVKAMDGVGGVKVYRADDWLGAGTVKIVITTTENTTPSAELVKEVKEALDPSDREGEGEGLSPIGHIVTVEAAASTVFNVSFTLTADGTNENLQTEAEEALSEYADVLNEEWEDTETITVYISGIIARLVDVKGVTDVYNVKINGSEENLTLSDDSVAALGTLTITEEG
ncbi:MAG: baseplate J/gp47 family protein [Clostridiales bacterium]|nr:baseplate J/gp47 family protein [Clostridiales bacterium]